MIETISIALLCTILGIVVSIASFGRTKSKDDKADGKQDGVVLTQLGYITSGIDDIKAEQREQRKINTEIYSRVSAVEASAKQAHKRLDHMEGREPRDHND